MNKTLEQIEKEIESKVTPKNKRAFTKAVIAGEKIMFDEKTHQNMELIKNPETRNQPVQTIAKGIAGLMWVMYMQSKKSMDFEVLILSSIVLMAKAIDFAERGLKIPFDNKMIADTTKLMAQMLFQRLGISPEQLQQAITDGAADIKQNGPKKGMLRS